MTDDLKVYLAERLEEILNSVIEKYNITKYKLLYSFEDARSPGFIGSVECFKRKDGLSKLRLEIFVYDLIISKPLKSSPDEFVPVESYNIYDRPVDFEIIDDAITFINEKFTEYFSNRNFKLLEKE